MIAHGHVYSLANGRPSNMDFNAVCRGALNSEIRRKSNQREAVCLNRLGVHDTESQRNRVRQLSTATLKGIESHKSFIAELRPQRRKIKWTSSVSDWDRASAGSDYKSKVRQLDLADLQIHGKPLGRSESAPDEATTSEPLDPADDVDLLEHKIRRCLKALRRTNKDIERDKKTTEDLQSQNQAIRKSLLAMPAPKHQTMRQSQAQLDNTLQMLRDKIAQLDEQITMIDWQKTKVEEERADIMHRIETEGIVSIVDVPSMDEASDIDSNGSARFFLDHSSPLDKQNYTPESLHMAIGYDPRASISSKRSVISSSTPASMTNCQRFGGPVLRRMSATPAAA